MLVEKLVLQLRRLLLIWALAVACIATWRGPRRFDTFWWTFSLQGEQLLLVLQILLTAHLVDFFFLALSPSVEIFYATAH